MIRVPEHIWWEWCQEHLDDSAGPVDVPEFDVVRLDVQNVGLTFQDPREETAWALRYLS